MKKEENLVKRKMPKLPLTGETEWQCKFQINFFINFTAEHIK